MRIEGSRDSKLVKVVLAGVYRPWLDENQRPRSRRSRCRSPWREQFADRTLEEEHECPSRSFEPDDDESWPAFISQKAEEREGAARDGKRKRVARRVKLYRSRWGADTDRACYRPQFKSNLRHDRISWSLVALLLPLLLRPLRQRTRAYREPINRSLISLSTHREMS